MVLSWVKMIALTIFFVTSKRKLKCHENKQQRPAREHAHEKNKQAEVTDGADCFLKGHCPQFHFNTLQSIIPGVIRPFYHVTEGPMLMDKWTEMHNESHGTDKLTYVIYLFSVSLFPIRIQGSKEFDHLIFTARSLEQFPVYSNSSLNISWMDVILLF